MHTSCTVYYFLADRSLKVEHRDDNGTVKDLIKKGRVPKPAHCQSYLSCSTPGGGFDRKTHLNVFGKSCGAGRTWFMADRSQNLESEEVCIERNCYSDADLATGQVICLWGHVIQLTGCDEFTRFFYKQRYGIGTLTRFKSFISLWIKGRPCRNIMRHDSVLSTQNIKSVSYHTRLKLPLKGVKQASTL